MNETKQQALALMDMVTREIPRLRDLVRSGPIENVIENHGQLVETLIQARTLAHELSEAETDHNRWVCLVLFDDQLTQEVLKLTRVTAAAVGK
jgi:hypothetical protein